VKSRTTADWYAGKPDPPPLPVFARDFKIDYFVEGSVRRSGDSIRITVQLIDGPEDRHLWSRDYDAGYSVDGYVRLQSEIVQQIASDLRLPISPEDIRWLEELPTRNLEAFEAFERGYQMYWTARAKRAAVPLYPSTGQLERAVSLDPDFALAHAYLARSLLLPHLGPDSSRIERARLEAERSLSLTADLPDGHKALFEYHRIRGARDEAVVHARLALEHTRSAADSMGILYEMAVWTGELQEAGESLERWGVWIPSISWYLGG
jgi:hypothetical protein